MSLGVRCGSENHAGLGLFHLTSWFQIFALLDSDFSVLLYHPLYRGDHVCIILRHFIFVMNLSCSPISVSMGFSVSFPALFHQYRIITIEVFDFRVVFIHSCVFGMMAFEDHQTVHLAVLEFSARLRSI